MMGAVGAEELERPRAVSGAASFWRPAAFTEEFDCSTFVWL